MVHVLDVSKGQEGAKSAGLVLEDCGKKVKTLPSENSSWNKVSPESYKLDIVLEGTK